MYIDSTDTRPEGGDQPVAALMRQHLEPLVWQYQVNLALYGHNHAVQRHSAAYDGRVVQASVAAVIDGEPARLQLNPQATVH
jgi:predicted phosphohydrolase